MEKDITIRIQKLIQVIKAVSNGDFSARAKVSKKNDEFDVLATEINMLVEEINERFEKLKSSGEQIKTSLEEKETFLKEIHHRIKNNLQIISSLLSLQSQHIQDSQIVEMLKASQDRIKLIALVHEKLYESRQLAEIHFAEYVQGLMTHLFRSYGVSTEVVVCKVDIKDVVLDMNTAVSCGLIINELVSNSLKHAFPTGRKGEIYLGFHQEPVSNQCTLIVSDNGLGFPKDLDLKNTKTLGFQLVNTIVNQLEGEIELDRDQGTKFTITFDKKKEEK